MNCRKNILARYTYVHIFWSSDHGFGQVGILSYSMHLLCKLTSLDWTPYFIPWGFWWRFLYFSLWLSNQLKLVQNNWPTLAQKRRQSRLVMNWKLNLNKSCFSFNPHVKSYHRRHWSTNFASWILTSLTQRHTLALYVWYPYRISSRKVCMSIVSMCISWSYLQVDTTLAHGQLSHGTPGSMVWGRVS